MQARLLLCLLVVGVIGAGWFGSEHVLRHNDSPDVDLTPAVAAAHPPSSSATLTSAPTSTRAAPAVQTYLQRQEFQRRLQSYIAQAASMAPDARASQAIEIEHGVDRYETAGELSAGEAMLLRAALIRARVADETEQTRQLAELATRYRQASERKAAEWAARPDPQFQEYKTRERRIVDEVMAMASVPGGLTRDEYLRQRLQQAREAVYADVGAH